jgi:hypothetical protein
MTSTSTASGSTHAAKLLNWTACDPAAEFVTDSPEALGAPPSTDHRAPAATASAGSMVTLTAPGMERVAAAAEEQPTTRHRHTRRGTTASTLRAAIWRRPFLITALDVFNLEIIIWAFFLGVTVVSAVTIKLRPANVFLSPAFNEIAASWVAADYY